MAALNLFIFRKNRVVCHQQVSKFLLSVAKFQPILDCFITKFKLKYDNFENIKVDRVNAVVFNLHEIKQSKFFWGHPVLYISAKFCGIFLSDSSFESLNNRDLEYWK